MQEQLQFDFDAQYMSNLLVETADILRAHGRTISDIKFAVIDGQTFYCDAKTLVEALDFNYNMVSDKAEINLSFKLIGTNFWLERYENNGEEGWSFKQLPKAAGCIKWLNRTYFYPDTNWNE